MPAPKSKRKATEPINLAEIADAIVFRWYNLAQEDHDMLTREGLDALHAAITNVLAEEGASFDART